MAEAFRLSADTRAQNANVGVIFQCFGFRFINGVGVEKNVPLVIKI